MRFVLTCIHSQKSNSDPLAVPYFVATGPNGNKVGIRESANGGGNVDINTYPQQEVRRGGSDL